MGIIGDLKSTVITTGGEWRSPQISDRVLLSTEAARSGDERQGSQASCLDRHYWMEKAAREAISHIIYYPEKADWGFLHGFEKDAYGRIYAEIACRSVSGWGFKVPRNYAVVFLNVTDTAPCDIADPGPRMIRYLPGFRFLIKGTLRLGRPPEERVETL